MHLADAFIQSDLQCIQAIHVSVSLLSVAFQFKLEKKKHLNAGFTGLIWKVVGGTVLK